MSDWSADLWSSDLVVPRAQQHRLRRSDLGRVGRCGNGPAHRCARCPRLRQEQRLRGARRGVRRRLQLALTPRPDTLSFGARGAGVGALLWKRCAALEDWPSTPEGEARRSEEHTSELQSLMRNSYAVFCLQKKNNQTKQQSNILTTIIHNINNQHNLHYSQT